MLMLGGSSCPARAPARLTAPMMLDSSGFPVAHVSELADGPRSNDILRSRAERNQWEVSYRSESGVWGSEIVPSSWQSRAVPPEPPILPSWQARPIPQEPPTLQAPPVPLAPLPSPRPLTPLPSPRPPKVLLMEQFRIANAKAVAELAALGYSTTEIDRMSPRDAALILASVASSELTAKPSRRTGTMPPRQPPPPPPRSQLPPPTTLQEVGPPTLQHKLATLRTQLSLPTDTLAATVARAVREAGLESHVTQLTLSQQLDACLRTIGLESQLTTRDGQSDASPPLQQEGPPGGMTPRGPTMASEAWPGSVAARAKARRSARRVRT